MSPTASYFIFTALMAGAFAAEATAYAPFMNEIKLSPAQMEIANAAFIAANILAELPSGMIADRKSRVWSVRMGAFLSAVGFFLYALANDFTMAVIAEMTIGTGMAFISGAAHAWVAEALIKENLAGEIRNTFMGAASIRAGASLLFGFLSAPIAEAFGTRATWYASTILALCAFLFAWRVMNNDGEPLVRVREWEALRKSLQLLRSDKTLQWIIALAAAAALGAAFNHFWQPYFLTFLPQRSLGWIWVVISLSILGAGLFLRRLPVGEKGDVRLAVLALLLIGLGLAGMAFMQTLPSALLYLILHEAGRGMIPPIADTLVQHRIESSCRATFGSLQALLTSGGFFLAMLMNAALTHGLPYGADTSRALWLMMGSLIMALTLPFFFLRPRNLLPS